MRPGHWPLPRRRGHPPACQAGDLRDSFTRDELPVNFILRRGRDKAERKADVQPKRRKMSANARNAISDAQKARWAKVKAAEKG